MSIRTKDLERGEFALHDERGLDHVAVPRIELRLGRGIEYLGLLLDFRF